MNIIQGLDLYVVVVWALYGAFKDMKSSSVFYTKSSSKILRFLENRRLLKGLKNATTVNVGCYPGI